METIYLLLSEILKVKQTVRKLFLMILLLLNMVHELNTGPRNPIAMIAIVFSTVVQHLPYACIAYATEITVVRNGQRIPLCIKETNVL